MQWSYGSSNPPVPARHSSVRPGSAEARECAGNFGFSRTPDFVSNSRFTDVDVEIAESLRPWTRNAFKTETLGVRIQLERGESEWNARLGVHSDDQVAAIAICKGIKMPSKYSPHTISLKVFKGDNREARQEGST
jgi:hypothetical protein